MCSTCRALTVSLEPRERLETTEPRETLESPELLDLLEPPDLRLADPINHITTPESYITVLHHIAMSQ